MSRLYSTKPMLMLVFCCFFLKSSALPKDMADDFSSDDF